jgi:two-component sensor histidine kinase
LRQLRHLTANALQQILNEVAQRDELRSTAEGRRLCEDIERRVLLSAALADALFGMTREPGLLPARLRGLGETVIGLLGDPDQVLSLDVAVEGRCPALLEEVVLRVAHELLGNAVKHGMRMRLVGRMRVDLASGPRGIRLVVADDGWEGCHRPGHGQGLGLVRALIAPFGGTLDTLSGRDGGGFTAEVDLPLITPADNRSDDFATGRPTCEAA